MILPDKIVDWPARWKFEFEERAAFIAEGDHRRFELDKSKTDPTCLRKVAEYRAELEIRKQAREEP